MGTLRPRDFLVRFGTGTGTGAHGLSESTRVRDKIVRKGVPLASLTAFGLFTVLYGWWRMLRLDSGLGLGLGK